MLYIEKRNQCAEIENWEMGADFLSREVYSGRGEWQVLRHWLEKSWVCYRQRKEGTATEAVMK